MLMISTPCLQSIEVVKAADDKYLMFANFTRTVLKEVKAADDKYPMFQTSLEK